MSIFASIGQGFQVLIVQHQSAHSQCKMAQVSRLRKCMQSWITVMDITVLLVASSKHGSLCCVISSSIVKPKQTMLCHFGAWLNPRPLGQYQLLAIHICIWDATLQCHTQCTHAFLVCRCWSTSAYVGPATLYDIRYDMFNVLGGNWDPTDTKKTVEWILRMLSLNERSHSMLFWAAS